MDFPVIVLHWLRKPHLAVTATVVVCILLFAPSSDLPEDTPQWINDKVAHGTVFAGLAFLWMQYLQKRGLVFLLMSGFAIFTEGIQYLLPASFLRSFDLKDMVADVTGILIGLVVSAVFDRLWPGREL